MITVNPKGGPNGLLQHGKPCPLCDDGKGVLALADMALEKNKSMAREYECQYGHAFKTYGTVRG